VIVTGQETGLVASFHCHHCNGNRYTELFELEGTLKAMYRPSTPCNEQGHLQLHEVLRVPSSLTLGVFGDRASISSLGNLFPCLPILIIKTLYLV